MGGGIGEGERRRRDPATQSVGAFLTFRILQQVYSLLHFLLICLLMELKTSLESDWEGEGGGGW